MSVDISSVRLPDDAFWQSGADRGRDKLVRKYKTSHFGVLIDAPREVALAGRTTLPLFAYYMGTMRQVSTRSFLDHGLLVVVDPDRNELYLADAEQDNPERVQVPETSTGDGDIPEGWVAEIKEVDVRERTQLPWKPGRVLSQVILLDLPSNRVETRLVAGASAYVDPEKEKFLAAERAKLNPAAPFPVLTPSAYEPRADSPDIPATPGLALQAARIAVVEDQKPVRLYGSFRLPVAPEEAVKPANTAYNEANGLAPFAASLMIHLVVVGTGQKYPFHYRLQIPVRKLEAGVATGHFTFDVSKLPDFPISEQTVFLYAFAKEWASAPVTMGIIDRRPVQ